MPFNTQSSPAGVHRRFCLRIAQWTYRNENNWYGLSMKNAKQTRYKTCGCQRCARDPDSQCGRLWRSHGGVAGRHRLRGLRQVKKRQEILEFEAELCVNAARIRVHGSRYAGKKRLLRSFAAAGLSGYAGLPEDAGMLFVFPEPIQPTFWMKGMLFAIDIIWIRDGTVVQIHESATPPGEGFDGRPTPALTVPMNPSPTSWKSHDSRLGGPPRHHHRQPRRACVSM